MSSETIVTALFLISAVIAAGVLINAIFPVIYKTSGTFGSVSQQADTRMRTDFVIVTTFAKSSDDTGRVWMKNIGTARIHTNELNSANVFFGPVGDFEMLTRTSTTPPPAGDWVYSGSDITSNQYWDPGETLQIDMQSKTDLKEDQALYFQFVLPTGVQRSVEFVASGS